MLQFRSLSANYSDIRFSYIKSVEGLEYSPYNDGADIATIGIGYNLRDDAIRALVLQQITGNNIPAGLDAAIESIVDATWSDNTTTGTIKSLNDVMSNYHSLHSNVPTTFIFNNETQISNVFSQAVNTYEARVNNKVSGIPESYERIALLSIAYTNANIIGPKLISAINNDNRAEAWYEIRYQSNDPEQSQAILEGIAKRRYYESEMFGLYKDLSNVTDNEAKNVIKMSLRHEEKISEYDNNYAHKIDTATDNANNAYNLSVLQAGQVQTLEESLKYAKDHLIEEYASKAKIDNIFVDYTDEGSTSEQNEYSGTDENDLIFGGLSNDLLHGGKGNDHIYGDEGVDTVTGGAGKDTFYGHGTSTGLDGDTYYGDDAYTQSYKGSNTINYSGLDKGYGVYVHVENVNWETNTPRYYEGYAQRWNSSAQGSSRQRYFRTYGGRYAWSWVSISLLFLRPR